MPLLESMFTRIEDVLIWGFLATSALTTLMYGSQGLGLSRLSLPFLLGTCLSARRRSAVSYGFALYLIGGWVFAFLYCWLFTAIGVSTWWLGALTGGLHGIFLLTAVLPVLPHVHPRMASVYDGPTATRRLEPPGFLALNYGRRTPLTTLMAHLVYGAIIGAGYSVPTERTPISAAAALSSSDARCVSRAVALSGVNTLSEVHDDRGGCFDAARIIHARYPGFRSPNSTTVRSPAPHPAAGLWCFDIVRPRGCAAHHHFSLASAPLNLRTASSIAAGQRG